MKHFPFLSTSIISQVRISIQIVLKPPPKKEGPKFYVTPTTSERNSSNFPITKLQNLEVKKQQGNFPCENVKKSWLTKKHLTSHHIYSQKES